MSRERFCRLYSGPGEVLSRIDRGAADAGVQHGIGLEADLLRARLQLDIGDRWGSTGSEVLTALGGTPSGRGKAGCEK